ncbi:MAG: glutathione S-transferase N-terminal domain-containing protein [Porticoccaceae bacterium]|nr:glutathione S-transferase N-terminal domain-containing protein [Porticoccaceae bacterium]
MLEKGVAFEEVEVTQIEIKSLLDKSPMGKVPFIEIKEGFLSESTAVPGFFENCTADEPIIPKDPFKAA